LTPPFFVQYIEDSAHRRGLYTLYCREWTQFLILLAAEFGCFLLITAGTVIVEAVEWFSGWIAEL